MKYDLNLIKCSLLPIVVNERDIEPTVIKKANQFTSFNFGDVQRLDILNFFGGAASCGSIFKIYKTWETNGFFLYEWFDNTHKVQKTEISTYGVFYSELHSCNPLGTGKTDYVKLWKNGITTE